MFRNLSNTCASLGSCQRTPLYAYSENKRYESFKTTVELLEKEDNISTHSFEIDPSTTGKNSLEVEPIVDSPSIQETREVSSVVRTVPSKKKPTGFSKLKAKQVK